LNAKKENRPLKDGDVKLLVKQLVQQMQLVFGDMNDKESVCCTNHFLKSERNYHLFRRIAFPYSSVGYQVKVRNKDENQLI
jgi:hypothetical protein